MKAKYVKHTLNEEGNYYEQLKKQYPDWNWDEAEEIDNEDLIAAAEMYDREKDKRKKQDIDEAYEPKDLKRVKDFAKKSGGDFSKEIALASQMAKTITNVDKAIGRAEAAAEVYGGWNEIVEIFYNKAKQLGYKGPEPGKRLESGIILGSKLPKEQQHKSNTRWRGYRTPILPIGKVDIRTGTCKYFNVYDTWNPDNTTAEVWVDSKNIDFSKLLTSNEPLSGISSILKPKSKEEIDMAKRKEFNYKIIFTSGKTPIHQIGDRQEFYHDQNASRIGNWQMVDYVLLKHLRELILPYGGNLTAYVYK